MKTLLLSMALLAGANSMACDALLGKWECRGNGSSTDTYSKTSSGLQVESVERDGTSSTLILDGKKHQSNENSMHISYAGTVACDNGSTVKGELQLKISVSAFGKTHLSDVQKKFEIKDGDVMTVTGVTTSNAAPPSHENETCVRVN